jgi:hypothetical protein
VRKVELLTQLACHTGIFQNGRSHETPSTTAGQPATIHQPQFPDTYALLRLKSYIAPSPPTDVNQSISTVTTKSIGELGN